MLKAPVIRLSPNNRQATLLAQHAGFARVAFNHALAGKEWRNDYLLRPRFNAVKATLYPWSAGLSQNAGKNAIVHRGQAIKRWGAYRKALKAGHRTRFVGIPRFRKKGRNDSHQADNGVATIKADGLHLRLPCVGMVRMTGPVRWETAIRRCVIRKDAGHWYASLMLEDVAEPFILNGGPAVGIDMGLKTLAARSDGTEYANPKPLAGMLGRLRRMDKAIARSRNINGKLNTNRRVKLYERRAALHKRIRDTRCDYHHKATTAIAKGFGVVKVETLNISGLMRKRTVARTFADAGVGEFLRQLEYKCGWYGAEFVKVDRWFPSSQLCHHCGHRNATLKLAQRGWHCGGCGALNQRDLNAALNIRDYHAASYCRARTRRLRKSGTAPVAAGEVSTSPSSANQP
jgi:putative transposase